jgi:hypothetical protein
MRALGDGLVSFDWVGSALPELLWVALTATRLGGLARVHPLLDVIDHCAGEGIMVDGHVGGFAESTPIARPPCGLGSLRLSQERYIRRSQEHLRSTQTVRWPGYSST